LETDFKDRQMRDHQINQIKLEERREELGNREQELRKKWRFLEKKRELLANDWEQMRSKSTALQ
jgi:hypothetical protein